jgi:hypothetical protein
MENLMEALPLMTTFFNIKLSLIILNHYILKCEKVLKTGDVYLWIK